MNDERPVILLIEADESLGRVVASYLHHDGYRVVRGDRIDAVRELAADPSPLAVKAGPVLTVGGEESAVSTPERPDLLVVDLDGLEPGEPKTQLADLTSVPVMLLASDRVPSGWGRHLERFPVLYKPFTIHELRRQVNDLLLAGGVQR